MSLFGSILSKIFHHGGATAAPAVATPAAAAPAAPASVSQAPAAVAPGQSTGSPVDVEQVLEGIAAQKGGGGNWRSSIVDLLKLLDLDSSLEARKGLANELNVHVGGDGTAQENEALSKAVWAALEQNGGKVPASLKG